MTLRTHTHKKGGKTILKRPYNGLMIQAR